VSRGLHAIVALAAFAAAMPVAPAAADCTCRAQGRDFELGESICMVTPRGPRLATCGMVLNNTSWRISTTPCVISTRPASEQVVTRPKPGHEG